MYNKCYYLNDAMINRHSLIKELINCKNADQAHILLRFFKTGKGDYGEGDKFLGIKVPQIRNISKKYLSLDLNDIQNLLDNEFHEIRFAGLVMLTEKYQKGDEEEKKAIFNLYISNIGKGINNWDLVDIPCPRIIGHYLFDKDRSILYNLSLSENLWERRVSIISTLYFIKKDDFKDTLKISKALLQDKHDLIHKAVGWMLREVGKRDIDTEREFLNKYCSIMPRTSLRYAIEKMEEGERKIFLNK